MKYLSVFLCTVFLVSSIGMTYIKASEEPSEWAQEEVTLAKDNYLVPEELEGNYQESIKRYEYVLLALEVLKMNGDHTQIAKRYPFTDIYGHPYEKEIVLAYNAGIIEGYGDGQFKPDEYISRQEIAALVYRVVNKINPYYEVRSNSYHEYGDRSIIRSWALPYIDYCYDMELMKGIGKNSAGKIIMSPEENASIEQAILLMYRLAYTMNVTRKFDIGSARVTTLVEQELKSYDSKLIVPFSAIFGIETGRLIQQIALEDNNRLVLLTEESARVEISNTSFISFYMTENTLEITGVTKDLYDESFVKFYTDLLKAHELDQSLQPIFDESIINFKLGENNIKQLSVSDLSKYHAEHGIGSLYNQIQGLQGDQEDVDLYVFKCSKSKYE